MTEIWSMAIPKNSKQKELAWDLIRELSSKENTVRIALNGNGPVRPAAYDDERLKKQLAYTVEESKAIQHALVVPSGVQRLARGADDLQGRIAGRGARPKDAGAGRSSDAVEDRAAGQIAAAPAGARGGGCRPSGRLAD